MLTFGSEIMNRSHALMLLSECTGDDIWSIEYCRQRLVPEAWIKQLRDAYESGFDSNDARIFYREKLVSQFAGVRDVDLACKLGQFLGLEIDRIVSSQYSRSGVVRAIREAMEES